MQNALSKTISLFASLMLAVSLVPIIPLNANAATAGQEQLDSSSVANKPEASEELEEASPSESMEVAPEASSKPEPESDLSDQSGIAALANEITLDITYSTPRCGAPMTFNFNGSGGDDIRYMINALYRVDNGAYDSMIDVSFNSSPSANPEYDPNGTLEQNIGKYMPVSSADLTFYSSGRYWLRVYAMDFISFQMTRKDIYFDINDPAYPTVSSKVDSIAKECLAKAGATDYDRALWLHDYLTNNNVYDRDYVYCSAEAVLGRGKGTCEAFVSAYHMLLNKVGISCERIESRGSDQHVWSNVRMDGKWYEVDVTWDCTAALGGTFPDVRHLYFGLSQDVMILNRKSYTGNPSGNIATSLDQNYFIKSRKITQYSDPYISQIQSKIDAGEVTFTLPAVYSNWPDNYKNVIYNLVAYELGATNWRSGGKDVSLKATYASNALEFTVSMPFDAQIVLNATETAATVKVSGSSLANAQSVQIPVWSNAGGQDDIVWYQASRQGAGWVANVDIRRNHKTAGSYSVHVYATKGGQTHFAGSTSFDVQPTKATCKMIQTADQQKHGQFTIRVEVESCPSGIIQIQAPTWSEANGQDDIEWLTLNAVPGQDGVFEVTTDCARGVRNPGNYISHIYATASNGVYGAVAASSKEIKLDPAEVSSSVDGNEMWATVRASGGILEGAQSVQIPVWSNAGGQDDIAWYQASKQGGVWTVRVDILRNHRTAGNYSAHCYATKGGRTSMVGSTSFSITAPTADVLLAQTEDQEQDGTFTTHVANVVSPSGVNFVQSPTWSAAGGQDDIDWSNMQRLNATTFERTHSCIASNRDPGTYNSHVYLQAGNGIYVCVGAKSLDVRIASPQIAVQLDDNQMGATLKGSGGILSRAQSVQFPVWSNAGGQDDIVWYQAHREGNVWVANVDIRRHRTAGAYSVHCYANIGGAMKFAGSTSFTIDGPTADISLEKTGARTFKVTLSNVASPSGITRVQVPIWSTPNQSDIIWYDATSSDGRTWTVNVNVGNHNASSTSFISHAYATTGNGITGFVAGKSISM